MAGQQGIRAGKAFVELYANDRKLVRGLRSAQRKLKRFGASITAIGAKLLGIASIAATPLAFTIKAASDMEETMNKFNVVFGESSRVVKEWGDDFAKNVGRSKEQIANFMAGSQDLFVPLGFEPGAATEMSKQITKLAVDLASFNNMADADVIRDLHAALTGSGEVMKKYGVLVSEAAVKQELLRQGMDPKTATDQDKVMARLSIIMKGTTAAQGDAIRSSKSFANQMKRLKAAVSDASVSIGNAILPTITKFVTKIADTVEYIGKWIEENAGLVKVIAIVATAIGAAGAALISLGAAAAVVSFAMGGLASIASVLAGVISFLVSPVGIAIAVLALFVGWLIKSGVAMEWLGSMFGPMFDHFSDAFEAIKSALTGGDLSGAAKIALAALELAWVKGTNKILEIWNAILLKMKTAWSDTVGGLSNVILRVTGNADAIEENNAITQNRNKGFEAESKVSQAAAEQRLMDAEDAYTEAKRDAKEKAEQTPLPETTTPEEWQQKLSGITVPSVKTEASDRGYGTREGLRSVIDFYNKRGASEDIAKKTLNQMEESNSILSELVDHVRRNGIPTVEAG